MVFDGKVEKSSYEMTVPGAPVIGDIGEQAPMRWLAIAATEAVQKEHPKLMKIYGVKDAGAFRG
jgi:hypothetical protein